MFCCLKKINISIFVYAVFVLLSFSVHAETMQDDLLPQLPNLSQKETKVIIEEVQDYNRKIELFDNKQTKTLFLSIYVPRSILGLKRGSVVNFNGIRVGAISSIRFDENNPEIFIAEASIMSSTHVTRLTMASVKFQGLTGIAYINLEDDSQGEYNMMEEASENGIVAKITTNP